MARTFTCNEEIIVVSKGTEDIGKLAMLGNGGKFDPSVIPEVQANIPAGVVLYFAAATPPKGWLKADGNVVSRIEYADLFVVVGTTFGTGDGSTTFNLPDLRGEFIRGLDTGRGVDSGRVIGTIQSDELKQHNHYFFETDVDPGNNGDSLESDVPCAMDTSGMATSTSNHKFVSNTGGSETRPRNVAC
jgi:microcystin-dependent protein